MGDCREEEFLQCIVGSTIVAKLLGADCVLTIEISDLSVSHNTGNGWVEAWVQRFVEGDEGVCEIFTR